MAAEQFDRRAGDANLIRVLRVVKILVPLGIVVLLVSAVFSTVAVIGARDAQEAVRQANENGATLQDLCNVARQQRHTLVLSFENSKRYLSTPAGQEPSPLNDFIRAVSLPQLKARIAAERVPPSCR